MKQLIISSIFFVISFVLFSTCSKESNPVVTPTEENENASLEKKKKKWPEVIYDSTYGEIVMDYKAIVPMAGPCGEKQTYGWGFDHYKPKSGKIVGVWPCNDAFTQQSLTTLRTKWGYSHLFFGYYYDDTKWNIADAAGYTLDKIMVAVTDIPDAQRASFILSHGEAYAYYVGEPADQSHTMGGVREALNLYGYSSLFVIDGYKRTLLLNLYVQLSDKVLFSAYNHWFQIPPGIGYWTNWPTDIDQRPDWSDMKNRYGNKFSMTWINTYEISEFNSLFGHAANLQLNGIWIYGLDSHQTDQWANISQSAFLSGYLRKFEQYFKIVWRCTLQDPCDCEPDDPDAGWYVYQVLPLGSYREVYP